MKLVKMVLKNFRGYKHAEINFDESFNVIIGRNDIGKSTILEALEIFFNNDTVKIDIEDFHVYRGQQDTEMHIQISFTPENKKYTIDTIPTDLKREYLLDHNQNLTIKKVWDCTKGKLTAASLKTYIIANYPDKFKDEPLISLKINDLKKKLSEYSDQIDISSISKNKSSEIRQAIYSAERCTSLTEIAIPSDKEDGKKISDALKIDMPLFFLFQSDRANKDSDKEVQDPLKAITKTAIAELEKELEEVKEKIRLNAESLGARTLEKLKEMSPEIANVLSPEMTHKAWDTLFSFSFKSDDGISINKRGSGVRRLILLNYFRAEAERQNAEKRNVIYAIEEPETSQHPTWQIKLFNALIELSLNPSTQVLITTHSPSLASLAEVDKVRFIQKENNVSYIHSGSAANADAIVAELGMLPDVSAQVNIDTVKVVLCVEGPTDVEFFHNISNIFEMDLKNDSRVLVICLGGGTLMHWVNKKYLQKLNIPQVHIYDNDVKKYQDAINEVLSIPRSWGTLTRNREIENYIHPSLINNAYSLEGAEFVQLEEGWQTEWTQKDIPKELSDFLKELKASGHTYIRDEGKDSVKRVLSEKASREMTKALLTELGSYDEVEQWFDQIKNFCQ